MRAGDSGSRGTRRLQPTVPGLGRQRRSTKGHRIVLAAPVSRAAPASKTGGTSQSNRAERTGQGIRQPGHDEQVRASARFIVPGRRVSPGTEVDAPPLTLQVLQLIPTALLIPEAMDAGPLRECADQILVDRWRGRSDCGGVHQASEIPAARVVTTFPASAAIPRPPRTVAHLTRPTCGGWNTSAAAQGPRGAPTMNWSSLYDLDFFWMTRANHCNLHKRLQPGWGRTFGSLGCWRAKGRRSRGVARRRAWSRSGLVWRPGATCGAAQAAGCAWHPSDAG